MYALLADLAAHEQFTDHFLVDWEVEGDTARFRAKGAGANNLAEIRVTECTPDRITEEGRGGKDFRRRTRGVYELRPAGPNRTDVTFTSEIVERGSRVEALADPLAKAYLRRSNGRAMERLKALLEK